MSSKERVTSSRGWSASRGCFTACLAYTLTPRPWSISAPACLGCGPRASVRGRHSADTLGPCGESHGASLEEWALSLSRGRNRVQRTEPLGAFHGRNQRQGLGFGEGRPLRVEPLYRTGGGHAARVLWPLRIHGRLDRAGGRGARPGVQALSCSKAQDRGWALGWTPRRGEAQEGRWCLTGCWRPCRDTPNVPPVKYSRVQT